MNIVGLVVITLWTGVLCGFMFGLLKRFRLLRVDRDSEIVGMDIVKHGEPAYPVSAYGGDIRHLHNANTGGGVHQLATVSYHGVPIVMPSLSGVKNLNGIELRRFQSFALGIKERKSDDFDGDVSC